MKYRKKPVIIDAVQWDGISSTANSFIGECYGIDWEYGGVDGQSIMITTLEGIMEGKIGDWIIKGVKGEFYPIKPDIFEETYELVED